MIKGNRQPPLRSLRSLHFTGGRFEESRDWIDFDILNELLIYKRILIAVARELWMQERQGRERLPRGFGNDFRLGIGEIELGSYLVHVECIVKESLPHQTERLHEAARIIDTTPIAAQEIGPLPKEMTDAVLSVFTKWGKSLRFNEEGTLHTPSKSQPLLVTPNAIRRLDTSRRFGLSSQQEN